MSVEREAAIALERLRDAADAAREAAVGARAAVEAPRGRAEPDAHCDASWRAAPDPLESAPPPRVRRETPRETPAHGDWTWRDLLSSVDDAAPRRQSRREEGVDPVAHLRRPATAQARSPALPIAAIFGDAGLNLDIVFSPSGLERIAQRARSGTQARRRAVLEAAPDATRALAQHFSNNAQANQEALQFLRQDGARIAELLGRGRAPMASEATRIFLLIDAAAG